MRPAQEAIASSAACGLRGREERGVSIFANLGFVEPHFDSLERLRMERHASFFYALSTNFQYPMSAARFVIFHAESSQFPDAATGLGEDREECSVSNPFGCLGRGRVEQAPASP